MEWKTRVTELLGCQYPVLQGAYAGLGTWQFAAAAAEAGAHGLITASVSRTPERLREDIRRCRAATDKSFGVNLSIGICPQIEEMLEVCIEEGVPVETAIYKPDSLAPRIKEAGVKWVHKVARVKDALHVESLGADAVIVVGLEGIGFKSPEQLPTLISTVWAKRQLKVPVIAAGGIGDARGFLGALGMGADAIMMGTAFMATKECPLKEAAKEALVRSQPDHPQLRHRVLATPDPEALAEVRALRDKLPLDKWLRMLEHVNLKETNWREATDLVSDDFITGRSDQEWSRLGSLAVAVIDRIPTVKEFIDSIIQGAEELLDSWQFLKMR
jgi:NAD(P)H-dependent flavin oxidoreductase YrpB (nitropropane dioxygenase family)